MSSEDTTKEKQNYLRLEILGKGYDPAKFVEYLSSLRPEGEDIDNWSLQDLKDAVTRFIEINPKPDNAEPVILPNDNDDSGDETPKNAHQLHHTEKNEYKDNDDYGKPEETAKHISDSDGRTTDVSMMEASSLNDERQQITRMIINQSDEERTAMNDFTFTAAPLKQPKLNELNGERRLKIKISE